MKKREFLLNPKLDLAERLYEIQEYIEDYDKQVVITVEPYKNDTAEILDVFSYWNSKEIVVHKKITDGIKRKIRTKLKEFSVEEIKVGIDNYSDVLKDPNDWRSYKWTLENFLTRQGGFNQYFHAKNSVSDGVVVDKDKIFTTAEIRDSLGKNYTPDSLTKEFQKYERIEGEIGKWKLKPS